MTGQPLAQPQTPTALHLLHVGSMDARLIGLTIERHWKHRVRLTSSLAEAEVVLVDCDRPGADQAFEQILHYPRLGVVCYAFHPKDHIARHPRRTVLGKPLNLEALPVILADSAASSARNVARAATPPMSVADPTLIPRDTAPQSLGHGVSSEDERDLCGEMEDIPAAPGARLPFRLFFEPDEFLIGHLFRAVEQTLASGRPHVISGLPRLIGVSPKPVPTCVTTFRDNQLRPFSMTQLPQATARIVGAAIFNETAGAENSYNAEDLLWNSAAWAARGRLPVGANPYVAVRMKAWPNFTRAFASPHALRIVALWTREHASPIQIAARLAIPQRYVFSVYSSAHFAGLLDRTPAPSQIAAPPPEARQTETPSKTQRPSILSRILRKLLNV